MKKWILFLVALLLGHLAPAIAHDTGSRAHAGRGNQTTEREVRETPRHGRNLYEIVDTGVTEFANNTSAIEPTEPGEDFYGQDANYQIDSPSYADNGDGTVSDKVTGLMWQKGMGEKMTYTEAFQAARSLRLGGHRDWRVPTIKELYSLIQFTGEVKDADAIEPFIDTDYFDQPLGDTEAGEREVDAQTWSATEYVGSTMGGNQSVFGVNFLDGRIKGYDKYDPETGAPNEMYFRFVRGNPRYGRNHFVDNHDGTITDFATGLMWQKTDSGLGMDWQSALEYAESLTLAGYDDWRLPNPKELQSIVDYTRSPQTHGTAAIDPVFETSAILDPHGSTDYPYFWTGTTHRSLDNPFSAAAYVAFGSALGMMNDQLMDVHGAGSQRSDPKYGDPEDYPQYSGPQGDLQTVFNHVRAVRNAGGLRQ